MDTNENVGSSSITHGVILAAGNGKRLKPFTLSRSKAMAPILGKPIVARVLDTFIANGITDVTFVVSPNDLEIKEYFEHLSNYKESCTINFAFQYEKLGMGHALGCAREYVKGSFIMSACDSLVDSSHIKSLLDTHISSGASVTLSLKRVKDEELSKRGIVRFDDEGRVVGIIEKPSLEEAPSRMGSLPLYVFNKEIMDVIPLIPMSKRGEYELQDGIQMLITKKGYGASVETTYRVELTDISDLLAINIKYLDLETPNGKIESFLPVSTKIIQPVKIDDDVEVGEDTVIGPNVYLEKGAVIKKRAKLSKSLVLKGGIVEEGAEITDTVVL